MLSRTLSWIAILLIAGGLRGADGWQPLFNGRDLSGWETYLGKPHRSMDVPGLKRDTDGTYLEPVGLNKDPLGVFKIATVDGEPAVHVSGQVFGVFTTLASYSNFRLRLQYKWGEKKWGSRINAVRDSGLLYFCHGGQGYNQSPWPRSIELQIQEHDTGDLFAIASQVTVPARQEGKLWIYDPQGAPTLFEPKGPANNRCVKLADVEKPHGEWNTVELICLGADSVHIVNGKVVMRLYGSKRIDGPEPVPLTSGTISLQTEGAELFYRNIEILPITAMPAEFAEK
jgi:hypothetical protein